MLFPLYPLLWRPLWWAGVPLFWAGLLLAHLAFFAAVALLAAHAAREWGEGSPRDAVVALLAFPWAFYLLAPYAESLFLALALGVFAAARRRRWALVALPRAAGRADAHPRAGARPGPPLDRLAGGARSRAGGAAERAPRRRGGARPGRRRGGVLRLARRALRRPAPLPPRAAQRLGARARGFPGSGARSA